MLHMAIVGVLIGWLILILRKRGHLLGLTVNVIALEL